MAITNHERVSKALDLLRDGLGPFVQREFSNEFGPRDALDGARAYFGHGSRLSTTGTLIQWDSAALLSLMVYSWGDVFRQTLGHTERSLVSELLEWRNKWAHQHRFSSDDAERALDSAARLLTAVSAPQADEVARMRSELRRLVIDEQTRRERRKAGGSLITPAAAESLRPWRDVVTPHADVASGRYQQAEFAADLWQVHLGEGADEYRDPAEFFRRTFLTESLRRLLVAASNASPTAAATRSYSSRPTSAAARRTPCSRSTTCSPACRPTRFQASTRSWPRPESPICRPSAAWCWSVTRSPQATRQPGPTVRLCTHSGAKSPTS